MPLKVNVNAVPSFIKLAAKSKNNLLVLGEPGVGKSSIICGMDNGDDCKVTMLTGSSTYEETVNGIPYRDGDKQRYTVPGWFDEMQQWCDAHPDGLSILFIDEFNTADDQVIKTFLSILTERKIPTQKHPLPDNTVIVAAMNPQDQNNGSEFIRPLASRFITVEIASSLESYQNYVLGEEKQNGDAVEVLDEPNDVSEGEIRGIIEQISPADWQHWEYGSMHEVCPRSVSNYIRACRYLGKLEQDCVRVGRAMLGFSVVWKSVSQKKAEEKANKVRKGQILLSREELESMSAEEIKSYMETVKSSQSISPKMLQTVSTCIELITKKQAEAEKEN